MIYLIEEGHICYQRFMVRQSVIFLGYLFIFRPHNVFGERMGMSHVIPELTKKILNKKQKLFVNNSNHSRAFCYIDDAIKMIILSMNTKKQLVKHITWVIQEMKLKLLI